MKTYYKFGNIITVRWSKANQAWFIMLFDQSVEAVCNTREDVNGWFSSHGLSKYSI